MMEILYEHFATQNNEDFIISWNVLYYLIIYNLGEYILNELIAFSVKDFYEYR